ncbi:MAG: hypothetical protein R2883_05480 [Caldisericia bacterium]
MKNLFVVGGKNKHCSNCASSSPISFKTSSFLKVALLQNSSSLLDSAQVPSELRVAI